MESKATIIEHFIDLNKTQIKFSHGGSISTYIPEMNAIDNISSFAKSRGIQTTEKLKKEIIETLNSKCGSEKIKGIVKTIINQIEERFQMQEAQILQEQKKADQEKQKKEQREIAMQEIKKQEEEKMENITIRKEKKEKKEKIEEKLSFKKRMIGMGLETEKHIDTIIDALLKNDGILESFLDKDTIMKIREKGQYGSTERDIQNPKIQNIVERFKWKMTEETINIPKLETIGKKPRTLKSEIDVEYKDGSLTTTLDEKTYDICKYHETKTKELLADGTFEIRGRLLGRVIEYIQMDILKEKLRSHIKGEFIILKTDIVDDTMTGIDFVLLFRTKEKNKETNEIKEIEKQCFIDTTTALNDETLFHKIEEAKKGKTPYNYYIERTREACKTKKENKNMIFPQAEKFIEESEQYTTPYLISKVLKCIEEDTSYESYIQDFFTIQEGKITSEKMDFQHHLPAHQKYRTDDIINNAKYINIKKIKEISIAA